MERESYLYIYIGENFKEEMVSMIKYCREVFYKGIDELGKFILEV